MEGGSGIIQADHEQITPVSLLLCCLSVFRWTGGRQQLSDSGASIPGAPAGPEDAAEAGEGAEGGVDHWDRLLR